ncbi:hypothetical protein HY772_02990 [Candidatus Woesearchaeota archaeon]|nr:hypothetical protein [Candidatus Woesearchaeota archaeon]
MFQLRCAGRERALARILASFLASLIILLAVVGTSFVSIRAQTDSSQTDSSFFLSSSSKYSSSQTLSSSSSYDSQSSVQVIEQNHAGTGCPFTVLEGNVLRLRAEGFDPDSDVGPAGELLWSYAPPVSPFGLWQTRVGDAGRYTTGIKLSDGAFTDTVIFCIDVVPQPTALPSQPDNHAPTLFGVDDLLLEEGQSVTFKPVCIDPDGDDVFMAVNTQLPFPVYESREGDAGNYLVQVGCTDVRGSATIVVQQVAVKSKNNPPIITVNDVTAYEGELITVQPRIADADNDPVTFSIEGPIGPGGVWQTYMGDAGDYTITVFASDGKSLAQRLVNIHVLAKQQLQEELLPEAGSISAISAESRVVAEQLSQRSMQKQSAVEVIVIESVTESAVENSPKQSYSCQATFVSSPPVSASPVLASPVSSPVQLNSQDIIEVVYY